MVRAEENTAVVLVTASELTVAVTAFYFGLGELAAAAFQVFKHELDCGVSVFRRIRRLMLLVCRRLSIIFQLEWFWKGYGSYFEKASSRNFLQRASSAS